MITNNSQAVTAILQIRKDIADGRDKEPGYSVYEYGGVQSSDDCLRFDDDLDWLVLCGGQWDLEESPSIRLYVRASGDLTTDGETAVRSATLQDFNAADKFAEGSLFDLSKIEPGHCVNLSGKLYWVQEGFELDVVGG